MKILVIVALLIAVVTCMPVSEESPKSKAEPITAKTDEADLKTSDYLYNPYLPYGYGYGYGYGIPYPYYYPPFYYNYYPYSYWG
ncbi:hypothetical protein GHT06_011729 [Daphnia sinensis]|uniref:Uncharacterized protein n=1 Tax=Daphnia sinensis TaxID=1820382 RepID=A0AAD5PVI3_9CRUS|nr:hypothetical protein GHT06_011729 [Daphnia sinensis]